MTALPTERSRPPYLWALLVAVAVFAVYLATLAPTTAFWDTSEYIAAAYVLGIPHPPGNPLFTLLAHAWGLIPLASQYAVRLNLFAAVTGAATAGFWFLVSERWLQEIVPVRWARLAAAAAGTLVGAFAWTVWNQSTVNEKVYTVSLLSLGITMWLALRWADAQAGPARDRLLILITYVIALSSTNHMMGVLILPTVGIYILATDWREAFKPWVLITAFALLLAVSTAWAQIGFGSTTGIGLVLASAALLGYAWWQDPKTFTRPTLWLALGAVVVGVSLNYLFLPMRAAQFPAINEGEPTNWHALLDVLNRKQYLKPSVFLRQADFLSQLQNYWQYFSWQWAGDCTRGFTAGCGWFARLATAAFTALGLGGILALWSRPKKVAALGATTLVVSFTLALVFYLNFKYGYSIHPERSLTREVRERDYFFIASFSAWGLMVAVGFGALMQWIVGFLRDHGTEKSRWALASPVLVLAVIPLLGNRVTASRAHETLARDVAVDMLQSVEPYGILITAGDNDTFPLWYAQEVEGIRLDVTLANLSLMNTDWHLRQLRRRPTATFDSAAAPAVWQGRSWPRPETPVLALTESQLDQLPDLSQAPSSRTSRIGDVVLTFGNDVLEKSDLATVLLIRDNLGKRPIYFSWSDGGYPDQTLGLSPYLVTQGLVRKLYPTEVATGDSVVLSRGFGYIDLPLTERLLWEVYHWQTAARPRPAGWIDPPSSPMLRLYRLMYEIAGQTFLTEGDTAQAVRADSVAQAIARSLKE
ncbi:MAG: DUF2723 domain-containing protein [Gemmatimonadales bacterium]